MIAPKGRGKTTLAVRLIENLPRVAVFDFNAEDGYALACDDIVVGSPCDFWASLHASEFSIGYRPIEYDPKTQECPGFRHFCRLGFKRGGLWLIVDEAHQFCTPHNIPPELLAIARIGRHKEVSLLYITQSFAMIEKTLTRNSNTFAFFKISDPADLEGIRLRCGKEVSQAVQNLRALDAEAGRAGELLLWSDTGESQVCDLDRDQDRDTSTKVLLHFQNYKSTVIPESQKEIPHDEDRSTDGLGSPPKLWDDPSGDRSRSERREAGPSEQIPAEGGERRRNVLEEMFNSATREKV